MRKHTKNYAQVIKDIVGEPKLGCEVGVWKGDNSKYLLRIFPSLRLLMVDLYRKHIEGSPRLSNTDDVEMLDTLRLAAEVTQFAANRRVFLVTDSVSASTLIADGSLDFVFIDADHSYKGVSCDLVAWTAKVRSGGVVGGHDYGGRGDRSGRFGVKRAVDEFAEQEGYVVKTKTGLIWWFVK